MTVQELIELLQEQPDKDAPVVIRQSRGRQWGIIPEGVVSEFDWREPNEMLTFIEF